MTRKDLEFSASFAWNAAFALEPEWAVDVLKGLGGAMADDAVFWSTMTPRELRAVRFSCYLTLHH